MSCYPLVVSPYATYCGQAKVVFFVLVHFSNYFDEDELLF